MAGFMRTVLIAAMLLGVGSAAAQPSDAPLRPPGLTAPAVAPPVPPPSFTSSAPNVPAVAPVVARYGERRAPFAGEVDERTAVTVPLLATLGSWGLMVGGARAGSAGLAVTGFLGTLLAPSTGHWYAHEAGLAGLGLRAAGVVTFVVGLREAIESDGCDDECERSSAPVGPSVLLLGGLGLYAVGTIYDLATSERSAKRHNAKLRWTVAPTVQHGATGLVLGGRF